MSRPTRSVRRHALRVLTPAAVAATFLSACIPPAATTEQVSASAGGQPGNAASFGPSITADGSSVAFASSATNLAGGGGGGRSDIFVKDRTTGSVPRISVAFGGSGAVANGSSASPSISDDASRVAFTSTATNLRGIADGNGPVNDVYVRLRRNNLTLLASVSTSGGPADGTSDSPDLSANGEFVTFASSAANLVTRDTNGAMDVFRHNLSNGTTTRVSLGPLAAQVPGASVKPSISGNGSRIAFVTAVPLTADDRDTSSDVYVRDVPTETTTLVSIDGLNTLAPQAEISDDGRFVAFVSTNGSSQSQTWVRNVETGELTLVSRKAGTATPSNGASSAVAISPDGSHVAFSSKAGDLVSGDTNGQFDFFVAARDGSAVERVSVRSDGGQSAGVPARPDISAAGREVTFETPAGDLAAGDTNNTFDVFLRDRG